ANKGDLNALREAVFFLTDLNCPTPDWVLELTLKVIDEKLAQKIVIGHGPKGSTQSAAARDWVDLRRWLAVDRFLRQQLSNGEIANQKVATNKASDFLKGTDATGTAQSMGRSWRR